MSTLWERMNDIGPNAARQCAASFAWNDEKSAVERISLRSAAFYVCMCVLSRETTQSKLAVFKSLHRAFANSRSR